MAGFKIIIGKLDVVQKLFFQEVYLRSRVGNAASSFSFKCRNLSTPGVRLVVFTNLLLGYKRGDVSLSLCQILIGTFLCFSILRVCDIFFWCQQQFDKFMRRSLELDLHLI